MKNILVAIAAIFAAIAGKSQNNEVFDVLIDSLKKWKVPGASLLIARSGNMLAEQSYGYSDLENKVPAKAVTKYEIASITKPITATGIMILVERGKIGLDSSIGAYIADVPDSHKSITIRQLLSHTSGLVTDHYDYMKLSALSPVRYTVRAQLEGRHGHGASPIKLNLANVFTKIINRQVASTKDQH